MNWVDAAVVLLLLEAGIAGYRRGLLTMAVRTAGLAAGIFAGWRYSPLLAQMLNERYHAAYYLQRWLSRGRPLTGEMPDYLVWTMSHNSLTTTVGEWLLLVIAFMIILMAVLVGVNLIGVLLCRGLEESVLGGWNRLGGMGVALTVRAVLLGVVWVLLEPLVYFLGAKSGEPPAAGSLAFYFSASHLLPFLKSAFIFCWTALSGAFYAS